MKAKKTKIAEAIEQAEAQGIVIPTWKRVVAANVASIAVNYAWLSPFISLVASIAAPASLFLAVMIWIVSMVLAIYAGMKVSQHVGSYILSGQIDRDVVKVKNKVLGLFQRKEIVAA
jgi:hypothetical protein